LKRDLGKCIELKPGEPVQVIPKEPVAGPPPGFIDNIVRVGRMRPDGTIEYTGTMPAFPEGWNDPTKYRNNLGKPKGADEMAKPRADKEEIMVKARKLMAAGKTLSESAREIGVPLSTLNTYLRNAEKAKAKVTPAAVKPEPVPEQVPEQVPELTKTVTPEPVASELVTPEPVAEPEVITEKIKNDWTLLWPQVADLLEQGKTQKQISDTLGIRYNSLKKKIEYERSKTAVKRSGVTVVLEKLKVRWCQDVLQEDNLPAATKLAIVTAINGLEVRG
jgi:DNA-binding CsgD family transcriptional regulator